MALRVGFDDQVFVAQRRGGMSRYFIELIKRFPDYGIEPVILSEATHNLHLIESGLVLEAAPRGATVARLDWATWRIAGRPRTMPAKLPQLDLMHHTFTNRRYLSLWSGPRVTTVHDMTPELLPDYFPLGNPHLAKRAFCEASDAVIAISHNTAADMVKVYGDQLASKTRVIHYGIGPEFRESRHTRHLSLPERYVLFVGIRSGYKDFQTALDAFAEVATVDSDLHLVVVGGGPFTPKEQASFQARDLESRILHLTPSDQEMPEVYRRARVFVFPSLYEGFGLPTLEALTSGTPTVLADASCSREIGGDAALYHVPGDSGDLAGGSSRL